MLDETTNWARLYATAALLGAGFGILLSVGGLPSAPDWPREWGLATTSRIGHVVILLAGGALVGVMLAGAAHLGVRYQLRRRSRSDPG